jgi:isopenicillin N synthase-like dioxygenase
VCSNNGFLYLKNFGLQDSDVDEAFAKSKQLFEMSDEAKAAVKPYSPATNTGFSKYATEALNTERPPDLKEAFNVRSRDHFANDYGGTPEGQGRGHICILKHRILSAGKPSSHA